MNWQTYVKGITKYPKLKKNLFKFCIYENDFSLLICSFNSKAKGCALIKA